MGTDSKRSRKYRSEDFRNDRFRKGAVDPLKYIRSKINPCPGCKYSMKIDGEKYSCLFSGECPHLARL